MHIDDRKLIAYVEGQLSPAGRAEVEAAVAADPVLGVRLEEQRLLRAAERQAQDNVVKLADRRKPATAPRSPLKLAWPTWASPVALVMAGLMGGYFLSQQAAGEVTAGMDGALVAQSRLARTLDSNLAGATGPIQIGHSFKATDGRYCRTFQVPARRVAGVACREGPRWIVRAFIDTPAPGKVFDGRPTISVTAPAILAAADAMTEGPPLDRQSEIAAKARRWRD